MSLKNSILFLGLGNCGCKQAKVFFEMGYNAMFVNGSEQDLKILGDVPNIYRLKNFDGFGGHRERALDCLAQNTDFVEALQKIKEKIVFVLHSTAGSTGSGSAPYIEELITEMKDEEGNIKKTVCPVPTLPSFSEPIGKKRSAYKAMLDMQEMQDILIGVQSLSAVQYPDTDGVMSKLKATFQIAESDWIEIDFSRWGSIVEKEKQYFEMLKRSILGRQEIQFLYYNSLGEVSQRRCQPLKMVYKDKAWYLYAYCLKRNDYRLFRISRIKELLVTDQYFKSHSEMKESVFSLMEEMGKPITIELSFPKEVSYRVYDTFEDDVIKWNGQEIRVNVTLPETEWLYSFIMSFGNQISILYPISLKEKIIERYKIALKHFEEDTR